MKNQEAPNACWWHQSAFLPQVVSKDLLMIEKQTAISDRQGIESLSLQPKSSYGHGSKPMMPYLGG